jgi:predicted AAA+ superfamily ATPase
MLKRKAWSLIEQWKTGKSNQGLLVTGARQVGKTYLIREYAKAKYGSVAEINLLENKKAAAAFDSADNAADLLVRISLLADVKLIEDETLIFIDEVQASKEIITAIKFLVEQSKYDFIISGSLLGVELKDIRSVPVGYLDTIEMYPLDFEEFCNASGVPGEILSNVRMALHARSEVPEFIHEQLLKLFYEYLIIGGMPAAIAEFAKTRNMQTVRNIQKNIIRQNKWDISRYNENDALNIKTIYDLIPAELNSQNKRFILKNMNERALFRQYVDSIAWLTEAGVAIPVYCVSEPVYPLKLSVATNLFKFFMSDVGLLTSTFMKGTSIDILARNPDVNYGAIYENAVVQELRAGGSDAYYYKNKKRGELDFVIETVQGQVLPIEVKSGKGYKRHNALSNLMSAPEYALEEGFVLCDGNVGRDGKVTYLPVYMAGWLARCIT